jgi:uncharacterized protein (DUF927 family)
MKDIIKDVEPNSEQTVQQIIQEIIQESIQKDKNIKENSVHEVVELMAHFMNYLSVSLYENQFTKNHQDAYTNLMAIYDKVSSQSSIPPSMYECLYFYDNIVYLGSVTYTDDPDYYKYKMKLRKYITELKNNKY